MTEGIEYLLRGFKLIVKPGLKRFVIIPLIINISIFVGFFIIANNLFHKLDIWLLTMLPNWLQWLHAILWVIFFACFFLITIYTFVTVANIIAAPFNSFLSEKVEYHLTGKAPPTQGALATLKDTPRIISRQLAIIGYSLPRALVLFILSFIPIVHFFAPLAWFIFSAWLMTLQYLDYPTDNHRVSFHDTREFAFQKRWLSLGFGATILVSTMIPIINLLVMPAAVAGATALWIEKKN